MVHSHTEIPAKKCTSCQKEMVEMFDCYVETCPECSSDSPKVLVNAEGVWKWS